MWIPRKRRETCASVRRLLDKWKSTTWLDIYFYSHFRVIPAARLKLNLIIQLTAKKKYCSWLLNIFPREETSFLNEARARESINSLSQSYVTPLIKLFTVIHEMNFYLFSLLIRDYDLNFTQILVYFWSFCYFSNIHSANLAEIVQKLFRRT